jgi:hypothetical protein
VFFEVVFLILVFFEHVRFDSIAGFYKGVIDTEIVYFFRCFLKVFFFNMKLIFFIVL